MEVIPLDDIMEAYGTLSEEHRSAVTNLMKAESYISVTARGPKGKQVIMDWQAAQPMSMHLILNIVGIGRNEFGRLWLNELRKKLSQMV